MLWVIIFVLLPDFILSLEEVEKKNILGLYFYLNTYAYTSVWKEQVNI